MTLRLFFLLFLLQLSFHSFAQEESVCPPPDDKKAQKLYEKADKFFKEFYYADAYSTLREVIDLAPDYADAHYLMGVINMKRSVPNLKAAQKSFTRVIEICPEYNAYIFFYLGDLAYSNGDNTAAADYMKKFLKDVDKIKSDKDYDRAESILKYAGFYAEMTAKPVPFSPVLLKGIGTPADEYLPIISPDNDLALFTRVIKLPPDKNQLVQRESMKERFMVSKRTNGAFDQGTEMPYPFNQNDNEGGACLTIDNKKLYYTLCKNAKTGEYYNCDICFSEYKHGSWDDIQNLGKNVNLADAWDSQPTISADGKTLYFVSDRKGGHGGYDIYKTTMDEKGEWTPAVNLGPPINTAGNEKSPFIHPDNHTLYFASDGHMGMGGYDLFFAKMTEDGKWGKARNLGYPINTVEDEAGFFVSTDGHYGYFASNKYQGAGGWDIFTFDLYPEARPEKVLFVKGELKDEEKKEPVRAKIELKNAKTKKVTEIPVDTITGEYAAIVLFRNDYIMTVKKEGYGYESKYIAEADSVMKEPLRIDMEIKPIKVGESYKLNDIYFETDLFALKPESKSIIEDFKEFLSDNPKIKVTIQGFTDDVGNDDYNLALSENRAKSVYEFLITLGIDKNRLTYKGYGESMPVAPNTTAEGRAKNRRTVFVITEK
jgi:outer membrane protein OmpA-like peptidoglycan-associated protein